MDILAGVVADLKDELAALRIERTPNRRIPLGGVGPALILLGAAGAGVWFWMFREKAMDVKRPRSRNAPRRRRRGRGVGPERLRLRHRAAPGDGLLEGHRQGDGGERRGRHGRPRGPGPGPAGRRPAARRVRAAEGAGRSRPSRGARERGPAGRSKLTLQRRLQLVKDSLSTQAEVDQAQAEVDSVEARIQAAQQQVAVAERQTALQQTDLDNAIIRAPFSGVALSKDAQPGEMVSPVSAGGGFTRTGISTIVDMTSLEIEVEVNEAYINRVTPRQRVVAVLDAYPDWEIPAHVITMVPTADRQKATVLVRVGFDALDPRILPDMGVKVRFLRDEGPTRRPARRGR